MIDTRRRTVSPATRTGWTLIELLIVIALISIVAGFAIPRLNFTRYRTDAAARLARVVLQEAQRNAITRQSNVIVSFDLPNGGFRIVQDWNNNDTINVGDQVQWRHLDEGAKFATPTMGRVNGGTATSALNGSGLMNIAGFPTIVFQRDGSSTTDLDLYVTTRVGVADEYRAIVVDQPTGRSDWFRWNGTAWVRMTQ